MPLSMIVLSKPLFLIKGRTVYWGGTGGHYYEYWSASSKTMERCINSWIARDVTKNQTKKLSILLSFYFHEVLQYLNTFT